MKIYSDILTTRDLYDACFDRVGIAECVEITRPRVRVRGWTVKLTGSSTRHRNSGTYGAQTWAETPPATGDEHGIWMARLFDQDPDARITRYNGLEDFSTATRGRYAAFMSRCTAF